MLLSSNLQLRIGSTKRGPTSVPSLSKSRPHVNRKFLCAQPRALLACACLPEQEKGPATDAGPMSLQDRGKAVLEGLSKYRRLITIGVAVLDVAFLWVAIKGVRQLGFWPGE